MSCFIRLAVEDDLPRLPEIERSAAEAFRQTDIALSVVSAVTPAEAWRGPLLAQTLWVVDDGQGHPVAFLGAEAVGPDLHILELDVALERQGQGLGRRLLRHVLDWARDAGFQAATLTTFRDVAWNGPFYGSLGFEELDTSELPERLAAILAKEAEHGLDPARRCAMRLDLAAWRTADA